MALVGLVRVSTSKQETQRQLDDLGLICVKVFDEKISGKLKVADRPGLQAALGYSPNRGRRVRPAAGLPQGEPHIPSRRGCRRRHRVSRAQMARQVGLVRWVQRSGHRTTLFTA
jgi:hypothetical protein